MLVLGGGTVELVGNTFESNYDAKTLGVGVVNLGGQVQCDVEHCLPVCTICLDDGWETLSPTSHPAALPNNEQVGTLTAVVACVSTLLVLVLVGLFTVRRRLNATTSATCDDGLAQTGPERGSFELPYTFGDSETLTSRLLDGSVETSPDPPDPLVAYFALLRASLAAIFVVNQSLRVELWSAGNRLAAQSMREGASMD